LQELKRPDPGWLLMVRPNDLLIFSGDWSLDPTVLLILKHTRDWPLEEIKDEQTEDAAQLLNLITKYYMKNAWSSP
jgi:hypothetical protein